MCNPLIVRFPKCCDIACVHVLPWFMALMKDLGILKGTPSPRVTHGMMPFFPILMKAAASSSAITTPPLPPHPPPPTPPPLLQSLINKMQGKHFPYFKFFIHDNHWLYQDKSIDSVQRPFWCLGKSGKLGFHLSLKSSVVSNSQNCWNWYLIILIVIIIVSLSFINNFVITILILLYVYFKYDNLLLL